MAKIDELKKQNPKFNWSIIDMIKQIVPGQSNKYAEMLLNLIKSNPPRENKEHINEVRQELRMYYGIKEENLPEDNFEMFQIYSMLDLYTSREGIQAFMRFCELNERKLIENPDVTTYKTFDQVVNAVAVAEMKAIDKELEKQISKVFEDDEWLLLRPLSEKASAKYGAGTKWCTTMEHNDYYDRYCRRGILIYNINKKTGHKIACFKNLDPSETAEFSFWNVKDDRIDSIESGLPLNILDIILNEIKTNSVTNNYLAGRSDYLGTRFSVSRNDERFAPLQEAINDVREDITRLADVLTIPAENAQLLTYRDANGEEINVDQIVQATATAMTERINDELRQADIDVTGIISDYYNSLPMYVDGTTANTAMHNIPSTTTFGQLWSTSQTIGHSTPSDEEPIPMEPEPTQEPDPQPVSGTRVSIESLTNYMRRW